MKWSLSLSLALLVTAAALVPASGQEEIPPTVPEPLPLGPDTSTFYFFGAKVSSQAEITDCNVALQDIHGTQIGTNSRPFASNNPKEPCALPAQPDSTLPGGLGHYERTLQSMTNAENSLTVLLVPEIPATAKLEAGKKIDGEVTMFISGVGPSVGGTALQVALGQVRPTINVSIGDTDFGPWDGAPEIAPESLAGPDVDGQPIYFTFPFDLGTTTDAAVSGAARLTIDFSNAFADADLRFLASKITLAVDDSNRGFVNIPFAAGSSPLPSPTVTPTATEGPGNKTDENVTGNETENETTPTPTPTNRTAENNTTGEKKVNEKGFLPGFELAAILSAGFLAAVFVERSRRRPPSREDAPPR